MILFFLLKKYLSGGGLDIVRRVSSVPEELHDEHTSPAGDNTVNYSNIVVDAVPEPSTTALLGLGGLALILRRRK